MDLQGNDLQREKGQISKANLNGIKETKKPTTISASFYFELKQATHFSTAHIALLCNIPLSTFYRLATGITKNPSNKTFRKLLSTYCRVCQLTPAFQQEVSAC
jgi:predicted transcriptional regulator